MISNLTLSVLIIYVPSWEALAEIPAFWIDFEQLSKFESKFIVPAAIGSLKVLRKSFLLTFAVNFVGFPSFDEEAVVVFLISVANEVSLGWQKLVSFFALALLFIFLLLLKERLALQARVLESKRFLEAAKKGSWVFY